MHLKSDFIPVSILSPCHEYCFGLLHCSDDVKKCLQVEKAASIANADDFIKALPEGYFHKPCSLLAHIAVHEKLCNCFLDVFQTNPKYKTSSSTFLSSDSIPEVKLVNH